jgi:hypothetical protein
MDRTHPDSGRIVTTGDVLNDMLDEIEQLREQQRQDTELIRQMLEALGVATTPLAKDRQEVLAAIAAAKARLGETNVT